ncbi:MAG: hypothetical protein IPG81_10120 [Sandaracinaceae bacterium]|nr:hypothetical protein [Sandaracinaceae bacterium]
MLAAALLGAPAEAAAQSCPAGQRCYYIPPHSPTPTNFSGIGWDLVISSSIGTVSGTYRFGAGAPVAFSAMPGAPTIIALSTANGVAANYHTVETRGVFIEADNDLFVATRMITGPWQDSASIKESSFALGTRFRRRRVRPERPQHPQHRSRHDLGLRTDGRQRDVHRPRGRGRELLAGGRRGHAHGEPCCG